MYFCLEAFTIVH